MPGVRETLAVDPGPLGSVLEAGVSEERVNRKVIAGFVGVLMTGGLASAAQAQEPIHVAQEPIREPVAGACIRPIVGEGGLVNLPGIDLPGKRIPNDSIELTIGGQYRDCKMGGIGV